MRRIGQVDLRRWILDAKVDVERDDIRSKKSKQECTRKRADVICMLSRIRAYCGWISSLLEVLSVLMMMDAKKIRGPVARISNCKSSVLIVLVRDEVSCTN